MTSAERDELEREIRHKILLEQREYKAKWRREHKESIKQSNAKYRAKKKASLILQTAKH